MIVLSLHDRTCNHLRADDFAYLSSREKDLYHDEILLNDASRPVGFLQLFYEHRRKVREIWAITDMGWKPRLVEFHFKHTDDF